MKNLFILIVTLFLCIPAFSGDIVYCGDMNNSSTYNAVTFEQEFLRKSPETACGILKFRPKEVYDVCISRHDEMAKKYATGKCRKMSAEKYKELREAAMKRDVTRYYKILNSL